MPRLRPGQAGQALRPDEFGTPDDSCLELVEKVSLVVILSEAKNRSCAKSQRKERFFVRLRRSPENDARARGAASSATTTEQGAGRILRPPATDSSE